MGPQTPRIGDVADLKTEAPRGVYGAILKLLFVVGQLMSWRIANRGWKTSELICNKTGIFERVQQFLM